MATWRLRFALSAVTLLLACAPKGEPPSAHAPLPGAPSLTAPGATSPAAPPSAQLSAPPKSPLITATGAVNYSRLRQQFAEPNVNIELNPRATSLSHLRHVESIQVLTDKVIIPASETGMLDGKRPGDVLYCDVSCGGQGFVRIIRSITPQSDSVVVATDPGRLTDVIQSGWLHAEFPVAVQPAPGLHQMIAPRGPSGAASSSPGGSAGQPGSQRLNGDLTGHLNASPNFQFNVVTDLVVSRGFLGVPNGIDLLEFVIEGTPSITFDAAVTASGSATKDWQFYSQEFPVGGIDIPVLGNIGPSLKLTLSGHAEADGELDLQANSTLADTIQAGFIYTSQDGMNVVNTSSFSEQHAFSATGSASAQAYAELAASLGVKFLGTGPSIDYTAQLGAEGQAQVSATSSSGTCDGELQGDFFFRQTGAASLNISLLVWDYSKSVTLASHTSRYPNPPWSAQVSVPCSGGGCSAGSMDCGSGCVDVSSDPANCGACLWDCTAGGAYASATCAAGQCACPNGALDCGAGCMDIASDPANCGDCQYDCTAGGAYADATCAAGVCGCPAGSYDCGYGCQDIDSDPANCGACQWDCTGGGLYPSATCTSGQCGCPAGSDDCGAGCQDIDSDPNNCGGCGIPCDPGLTCSGGVCG